MTRAEMRRKEREKQNENKTFVMTKAELDKIRNQEYEKARQVLLSKNHDLAEEIFKMMLVIPTNVLISDYWEKSAKKRIPQFVDDCLSLYESWQAGSLNMDDMISVTEKYAGITLVDKGTSTEKALKDNNQI